MFWGFGCEVLGLLAANRHAEGCEEGCFLPYSGCRLKIAGPGGNSNAIVSSVLYQGIGSPKNFALRDLARRAILSPVLLQAYTI